MDCNSSPRRRGRRGRGRGQCWRPKTEHFQNPASGSTANSPSETPYRSKDDASSYQTQTSLPKSFDKSSKHFGHAGEANYQYQRVRNSPISPGGEKVNLVNFVSHVTEAVTPNMETCFNASVSYPLSNLTGTRFEPWGPGNGHMLDDREKSGDYLHFGTSFTGSSAHCHDYASGATENSPCEIPYGGYDEVSSYQSRNSQPTSFCKKSNQHDHNNALKFQYRQVINSPISSGGENFNLVNHVSHVTEAVTPIVETCYHASVSYHSSNLRDARLEPWGPGKRQIVDGCEKSGDSLHFGSSSAGSSAHLHEEADVANTPSEISSRNKGDVSSYGNQSSKARSTDNSLKQFNHTKTFEPQYKQFRNSSGANDLMTVVEKLNLVDEAVTPRKGQMVDNYTKSDGSLHFDPSLAVANMSSPFSNSNVKDTPFKDGIQCEQNSQKEIKDSGGISDNLNCQPSGVAYDICPQGSKAFKLKPSLHQQNRMKRDEEKRFMEGQKIVELRSGMILLKKYISFNDQVKIINEYRDLGLGPGGFYEPGYRDGGKLHLKMMCLGKNWDPQKREYGDKRQFDDVKPPSIPKESHQLVKGAIEASHSFLRERSKSLDVKRVLPLMTPNICIVNFYTQSGRLGLHQDKDESKESIDRQLPVVSFSIGDSAEFLYGDQRDPEKADKVLLESGDVLIFGGKSRLVFHGVTSIVSDTAPKALLEETHLRSGRLNLTFRES